METGEKIGDRPEQVAIETGAITRYLVKEDWIWDRQRSERYVRIIGIAPRLEEFDDEGLSKGFKDLFWFCWQFIFLKHGSMHVVQCAVRSG